MPQPQSLPAQHQHHPKQANYQHPSSNLAESQPQPVQQHAGVEQQIQQNQEQQFHAQASPSIASYASSETQTNEGRSISCKDIQLVQNLIERCLQLYMNKGEVINTLLNQAKIQRSFTSLVWQKLEEQNPDFFRAYYTRLKLKKQIMLFNELLEQQADLMQKMRILPKSPLHALANDMHLSSMHQLSMGYPAQQQTSLTAAGHPVVPAPPTSSALLAGGASMQDGCHRTHGSPDSNCLMDVSTAMQPSSLGISSDASLGSTSIVPSGPTFPFCAIGNPMEMSAMNISLPAPLPLDTSFSTHEPNSQNALVTISMSTADTDGNSIREGVGSLGHLPRNFSLSDLTAELGPNSDLGPFGSYSSPFLTSEEADFDLDDERILESMHEPLNADFGDFKD
ncbi:hypothetical protein O6H91_17G060800 [Diphasiastrum complanatum]|uniref:Uncharacterized protein n=1 Tax=Diphasiastrum complanatum TaxID=34168 RepID=A0ACC2B7D0_DIPCM|nr:hypothetical protein O6H91_17G060800 [Diphasiastrum complanatum]